jgi:hypothetical protein
VPGTKRVESLEPPCTWRIVCLATSFLKIVHINMVRYERFASVRDGAVQVERGRFLWGVNLQVALRRARGWGGGDEHKKFRVFSGNFFNHLCD